MPSNLLKRKAESNKLSEKPCKIIRTGGRKIVHDSDDDVPSGRRGRIAKALDSKKRGREEQRVSDEIPAKRTKVQTEGNLTSISTTQDKRSSTEVAASVAEPIKPQRHRPAKPSLSFFHIIQRKGVQPLPPKVSIRKEYIPKQAATKHVQVPKPLNRSSPKGDGSIQAPKGADVPSTASPAQENEHHQGILAAARDGPKSPPKRKAEEPIQDQPAKRPATERTKPQSWLVTGKVAPINITKQYINKAGKIIKPKNVERAGKVNGEGEETKRDVSANWQKKASVDEVKPPAGLMNIGNACFANAIIQALDSVPELRDHLISRDKQHLQQGKGRVSSGRGSISACLGRLFQKMQSAAHMGMKESAEDFFQAFSSRHHDYDGGSQQEAYDFLEKLFKELEAEDVPMVKRLFAGQKVTRLECIACGKKQPRAEVSEFWSLQLEVPEKGREASVADCLKRALALETPEGYRCESESCRKMNSTSKGESIETCGDYLLLNCNRAGRRGKIGTKMPIPEYVDLDEHVLDRQPSESEVGKQLAKCFPDFRYKVVAFTEHTGAG
ncbi:MAG: hypothetical protein Q9219_004029 [cf. Caloplaca sp. 3 TL-2023]